VGPPPYPDGRGYAVQRKWSNLFEGADFFISSMLGFALSAPGYTMRDVNDWLAGQSLSAARLIPQTSTLDAKTLGGEFAVPVFVIQGAEDFTTPTSLARSFVNSIRAPRKAFVAIEGGGHFVVFMKSEVFLNELVARVLPLAMHTGAPFTFQQLVVVSITAGIFGVIVFLVAKRLIRLRARAVRASNSF
jgi:pimeloyl-ACP methyl ester carboxylesterase